MHTYIHTYFHTYIHSYTYIHTYIRDIIIIHTFVFFPFVIGLQLLLRFWRETRGSHLIRRRRRRMETITVKELLCHRSPLSSHSFHCHSSQKQPSSLSPEGELEESITRKRKLSEVVRNPLSTFPFLRCRVLLC